MNFETQQQLRRNAVQERLAWLGKLGARMASPVRTLNQQIHFGEILELQMQGVYKATRHRVIADPESRIQYSIVYFAIPDWETKLPDGQTVGEWLEERLKRSRKEAE